MKIKLKKIAVRELVEGYTDDGEGGVRGFGGKLDIRPPYQREFVYKDKQRDAVIETINQDFPLNVMYWAVREDGTYEVIDGQQRTISIAQYVEGDYSIDGLGFFNLQDDEQERILNYDLQVYVCEGTASEKLAWFRIINIAGVKLTDQEMRNAVYAGSWVTDAKRYFSRLGGPAHAVGDNYVKGSPIRQEFLENAIRWIKDDDQTIEEYMSAHQHEKTAIALWNHFRSVIDWLEAVFPKDHNKQFKKFMKGVDWGGLYRNHKDESLDPEALAVKVKRLMLDDEVQRKAGIYPYVLAGEEKHLHLRAFSDAQKLKAFEKLHPAGVCPKCGKEGLEISHMEADHITPWSEGGKTTDENCQMLCRECNRRKSNR